MDTNSINTFPPKVRAMLEEAIRHAMTGKGDTDVLRRIHEEAERIRDEVRRKHGVLDIGVSAIRELRAELPAS
jgi:hypothetical protein